MTKIKLTAIGLTALAIVMIGGSFVGVAGPVLSSARAGTLLYDSFDDGDHMDGVPATWTLGGLFTGSVDASSGDLVLSPDASTNPNNGVASGVVDVVSWDTSVRSQLSVGSTGGSAGIHGRIQNNIEGQSYFAAVAFLPNLQNVLLAGRTDAPGQIHFFDSTNGTGVFQLPYDVRFTDTVLQLDVFGDEIRVYAWREGDSMPTQPQFFVTDTTYREPGFVGVSFIPPQPTGAHQATFRYFHAADMPIHQIPEPPAAALGTVFAAGTLLIIGSRRAIRGFCAKRSDG